MLIAQAIVERGVLESMAVGVERIFTRVEVWVGSGNAPWVIGGLLVVLAIAFLRRR